jgi:amidase
MTADALLSASACTVVARLRAGEVTPLDLLDVLEARIAATEPKVNALPTLCFERARASAKALMARAPGERGLLAGLPVPIKDLTEVAGVRTTYGSTAYADHVSEGSDLLVEHLEAPSVGSRARASSLIHSGPGTGW